MALFQNDKDLVAKLEASQAEVAEHEATIIAREDEAKQLTQDLAASNESITELTAELTQAKADADAEKCLKEANAEKVAELKASQTDFDSKVAAAAAAKMAELGVKEPVEEIEDENDKEMSRAEFNKLTPSAKSAFAISGGRIN